MCRAGSGTGVAPVPGREDAARLARSPGVAAAGTFVPIEEERDQVPAAPGAFQGAQSPIATTVPLTCAAKSRPLARIGDDS